MHQKLILDKISDILSATDDSYDAKLIGLCEGAKRIFVAGAGRSGLISKFFAMRLMHAG